MTPLMIERSADREYLNELIYALAWTIEQSLLMGGAKPGVDYTHKDLYDWAMPFALKVFSSSEEGLTPFLVMTFDDDE